MTVLYSHPSRVGPGSRRETPGKHQRAWLPASKAHRREPGMATWRCALTMGCGRMARVHPVVAAASSPPATPTPPPRPPAARVATPVYHPPVLHRHPRHVHPMVTRHAAGTLQPRALSTMPKDSQVSPVPSSVREALIDTHWRRAMEEEYVALLANQTWDLVPRPPGSNIVTGKCTWTHKRWADGTLERYKARWVLRGFTQCPGVDYDETSAQWSSRLPSARSSRWLSLAGGLCISWTSRMPSCMAFSLRQSTAPSRRGLLTLLVPTWYVGSTNLSTASSRPPGHGTIGLLLSY